MAGREQKAVARTDVTAVPYDKFVEECQRLYHAPNGATIEGPRYGRDRKITLKGALNGRHGGIKAEVVLDRHVIEVSTMINAETEFLLGLPNIDILKDFVLDPTGPIDQLHLMQIDQLRDLHIFAYRVGGRPPYIVVRAMYVEQLRSIFEWLFGVPDDFEVTRKRSRDARDD